MLLDFEVALGERRGIKRDDVACSTARERLVTVHLRETGKEISNTERESVCVCVIILSECESECV